MKKSKEAFLLGFKYLRIEKLDGKNVKNVKFYCLERKKERKKENLNIKDWSWLVGAVKGSL